MGNFSSFCDRGNTNFNSSALPFKWKGRGQGIQFSLHMQATHPSPKRARLRIKKLSTKKDDLHRTLGKLAAEHGIPNTSRLTGKSRQVVRYWLLKHLHPEEYHPKSHGGSRGKEFRAEIAELIEQTLWDEVKLDPTRTLRQYQETIISILRARDEADVHQKSVSCSYLSNIFDSWGWRCAYTLRNRGIHSEHFSNRHFSCFSDLRPSWQICGHKLLHKYTDANMQYYNMFVNQIRELPNPQLVFLDEVHFNPFSTFCLQFSQSYHR